MTRKEVRMIQACAWCIVGIGVVVAVIRFINTPAVGRNLETVLASIALGGVVALVGGIALVASSNRPTLLWILGLILAPLSLLSFAGLLLPLLIPAFIFFRIALNHRSTEARFKTIGINAVIAVLMFAAIVSLFMTADPREYYDEQERTNYSTSDEIATHESISAIVLSLAAIAAASLLVSQQSAQSTAQDQLGTSRSSQA